MVKNDFFWIGSTLWLDFVNTENMATGERTDQLVEGTALLEWLSLSGSVPEAVAQRAASWPKTQWDELRLSARKLRQSLRAFCEEFDANGEISPTLVKTLNEFLGPPAPGYQLEPQPGGGFSLTTQWGAPTPRQLLFPIAKDAAETLSGGDLSRLRKCANPKCILWFLDTSKNGQRRWCSMEACGNRHKVSEHHRRKKAS
ncbi:hypothetical protein EON80_15065 [bacterium]|nr:MAG: hypothetical protein EON80_15065 [bacterium]